MVSKILVLYFAIGTELLCISYVTFVETALENVTRVTFVALKRQCIWKIQ